MLHLSVSPIRKNWQTAICIAAFVAALGSTTTGNAADAKTLDRTLSDEIAGENLSTIVAIAKEGQIQCLEEFGSFANDHLNGANTLVDLGSIAKLVTGVAVLKLVEEGKLQTLDALVDVFQNVPTDKSRITIRQLLTHRAGFPESIGDDEEKIGKNAFLERLFATPLRSAPGEAHHYSNAGYSLLAASVEQVSGISFETYVITEVLQPSGLNPIGYEQAYDEKHSAISGRSWLTRFQRRPIHEASWGGMPVGWYLVGNGGAVATPENFIAFLDQLFSGEIIDLNLLQNGFLKPGEILMTEDYYAGMVKVIEDGKAVYTHSGGNDVFSAEWRYAPADKSAIFTAGLGEDALYAMKQIVDAGSRSETLCVSRPGPTD